MRTHKAKVTLECLYQRHRPEDVFSFPEGPQPWTGEWRETSRTPVENNLEGTAHVCTVTYEAEVDLWTPDEEKADKMLREWSAKLYLDDTLPQLFCPNKWNRAAEGTSVIKWTIFDGENVPMVHNAALPWRLLVDPNMSMNGSWAKPKYRSARIDAIFETLRDLATSAQHHEDHPSWHNHQAIALLSGGDNGMHFGFGWKITPVTDFEQIKQRFVHALLASGHSCYDDWRREAKVSLEANHHINASLPRNNEPYIRGEDLRMLFRLKGCKTAVQLNGMHPKANEIYAFGITISPNGFSALISYGYQGSSWTQELARTRFNEPFLATLTRAKNVADKIVPDMRQTISDKYWKERENA